MNNFYQNHFKSVFAPPTKGGKLLVVLLLFLGGLSLSQAQTISTSAIAGSPFCPGASVNVSYTKTGTFSSGNVFTAQLSNSVGSFASPTNIGTLASTANGTIAATIPAIAVAGTGYRIRVVGSIPSIIGGINGANLTISAKPSVPTITTDYCVGGGYVQLTSSTASTYLWNTGETTQTILVNLAGSYTVRVSNASGCTNTGSVSVATELVVNGGFELGNTGFTSDYPYLNPLPIDPNGLNPENLYTISTDAHFYHTNFWGRSRLNTGSGNFMIVNGSSSTPSVWKQTVNVVAGTTYYFSAYGLSLNDVAPFAQLQFNVAGAQIGTVGVLGTGVTVAAGPFNWVRFSGQYVAATTGSILLSIIDLEPALGGNDFGLDDISFSTLSPVTIAVNPIANGGVPACTGSPINLSANLSGGMSPFTYAWTGPSGFTSSVANPVIASAIGANAGVYTLTITDANGCTDAASTSVIVNPTSAVTSTISRTSMCLGQTVNLTSSGGSSSATVLAESFDGITNAWTKTNTSSGGTPAAANWTLRPDQYNPGNLISSNNSSQFFLADSYTQNGTSTATILTSPVMNTVGYTSLSLNFYQYYRHAGVSGEAARVEVSTNGTGWTTLTTYTSNQGSSTVFANPTINLNAYINQATLYVRFRYNASARARYWAIDNVTISGATTPSYSWVSSPAGFTSILQNPTNVAPTVSTSYTATVTSSIGCSASATPVSVVVGSVLSSNASPALFCGVGGVSTLTITAPTGYTADWYANSSGGLPLIGGSNTLTYSPLVLSTNTYYAQVKNTSLGCTATSRTGITVTVSPNVAPSVSAAITTGSNPTCTGNSITFTATPTNGGALPGYQWTKNGVNIGGATSVTYTAVAGTNFVNGDIIRVVLTSTATCAAPLTATSAGITMTIAAPVTPSVTAAVTTGTNPTCSGNSVTFTATPTNGGASPGYQWTKNGTNISGATSVTYTGLAGTNFVNGDLIRVVMTSSATCPSPATATSAAITMSLSATVAPSVSIAITSGTNPTCNAASVTFTATPTNGGASPGYQWTKNGSNIGGATSVTYTAVSGTDFVEGDLIACILTSNATCVAPTTATSASINMGFNVSPTASATISAGPVCAGSTINLTSTAGSFPTVLLSEDFNAATNSWTTTNSSTGGTPSNAAWTLRPDKYNPGNQIRSNDQTQFYNSNSRGQGGGTSSTNTTLTSPAISTVGYSALSLDFYHYYLFSSNTESINLEVSTDAAIWNTVASSSSNEGSATNFSNVVINLDAYVNNPTFYIRFHYITNGRKRYWAIDNVTLTGTPLTYSYSWASTPSGFSSLIQNPTATPSVSTSYTATITNNLGCSTDAAPVSIVVNPSVTPSVTASITTGSNPTCSGTSVTFTASPTNGGATPGYQWTKNGVNISGANSVTYTGTAGTNFVNGDLIRVVLTSNATCASPTTATSTAITMNVTPTLTPTIVISSTQSNLCSSGVSFSSVISNGGAGPLYQWNKNGVAIIGATSSTYSSTGLVNGDIISCDLTSNASCVSPSTVSSNNLVVTLTGATTTWLGLTNDWSVGSPINWSNGYPSSNTTAIIPAGTGNDPEINGIVECFNVEIQSGASLTINGVNQLNVYGKFTNDGTFNAGFGSVEFLSCSGSSQAHAITSSNGTTTTFFSVRLDDVAGLQLTSDAKLKGTLTLTNGTFTNTSNAFTLISTATGTARIASVGATANYAGNITMQRFAPGPKTGWAQLGTPIQGATLSQWYDNFAMQGFAGVYGGGATGFVSVYTYNEPTPGAFDATGSYSPATNVTNSIPVGKGFWVYLGTATVNTANITIDVTGQPQIGNFSFNPSYTNSGNPNDDGFNLVANPYPSAIDWLSASWTKTNINDAIYMYQADNGQYASFVGGIATNGGSRYIASSQGFFIQTNANSPVLNITENAKTASNPVLIKDSDPANVLRINVEGDNVNDEMVIHLNENATENFDGSFDAKKIFSNDPSNPSISSINNGKDLAINSLPFSGSTMSIPVRVNVGSNGMYHLNWTGIDGFESGSCFVIEDLDNGTKTVMEKDAVYYFTANVGFKAPRFLIHISTPMPSKAIAASCSNSEDGSITLTNPSATASTVTLKDASGTTIKEATVTGSYTFEHLAAGMYQVAYPNATACGAMNQMITVPASKAISANFETTASEVFTNEAVNFSTTIAKDSYITWDFGDGAIAQGVTASHNYQTEGTYTVSMTNQKGECIATESKMLSVKAGGAISNVSMDVQLQNGSYYAVFYFNENTKVNISIVNALGQELSSTQSYEGKSGKVKLQLDNVAEGVYLVSLRNGNELLTKKIVK